MKNRKRRKKVKPQDKKNFSGIFVRAARAGRDDLISRVPELSYINDKKVTVIGLGSLGAPSVIELARCCVGEIRILDFDIVEAGTIVRWPLGLTAVGRNKTEAILDFIKENYPYTKIVPYRKRIGSVRLSEDWDSDLDILTSALDGTDLIYDATAEIGVQHLLSDLAAEQKKPYICISTTNGAWGGILTRIRPQVTEGCWQCFLAQLKDKSIPLPSEDPNGALQPIGCADPTFTGSGFDTGIIALSGVRLAVSTLTAGQEKCYPGFDWDIAVINLRDDKGNATIPSWSTFILNKHPSCFCSKEI